MKDKIVIENGDACYFVEYEYENSPANTRCSYHPHVKIENVRYRKLISVSSISGIRGELGGTVLRERITRKAKKIIEEPYCPLCVNENL